MVETNADWLASAPFSLSLGAGYFGFFAHVGMLAALEEAQQRPRRVIGVSAGAIAGSLWAAGASSDTLRRELVSLRREDFWDPAIPPALWVRGRAFARTLDRLYSACGVARIEDTRTPLALVTFEIPRLRTRIHERGPLQPLVRASAAVPALFRPVIVGGRVLVDGGAGDRSGRIALAPGERCLYHHIPHGSPWSALVGAEIDQRRSTPLVRVVCPDGVPRPNARDLSSGEAATRIAYDHMRRWLDAPARAWAASA